MQDEELSPVHRVIQVVARLSEPVHRALVERLSPPHTYLNDDEIEAALSDGGLSPEEADMLAGFLISYAEARADGVTKPNVLTNMATRVSEDLGLRPEPIATRVHELAAAPALEVLVLAKQSRERRVNIVVELSIETDVRPLFHEEYGEAPAAETVSHALRLAATSELANESRPRQVFEFILDQNDLAKLVNAAQSALLIQHKIEGRADQAGSRASFDFRAGRAIRWQS